MSTRANHEETDHCTECGQHEYMRDLRATNDGTGDLLCARCDTSPRRVSLVGDGYSLYGGTDAEDGWYYAPVTIADDALGDGFVAVGPFASHEDAEAALMAERAERE